MFLVYSFGVFLWLLYGIFICSFPVIVANGFTLVLSLAILGSRSVTTTPKHRFCENRKSMSHEGIRLITAEQARREEQKNRELPREAKEPVKVRVHKTEGTGLEIDWKDGHHSMWSFAWLRHACPCATCHDEREKSGRKPGEPKPQPQTLLPMYQSPPRPNVVAPVGRYALSFEWNDGHKSGIYSWDYLRRHCVCEVCRANPD